MAIKSTKELTVKYLNKTVGYLNYINDIKKVSFVYDDKWVENGFSISPFSLPLRKELYIPKNYNFKGLFGVFADSLPDSWGMLLLDRKLKKEGYDIDQLNVLDYLAIVGNRSNKALTYHPRQDLDDNIFLDFDLDLIANDCLKIINGETTDDLDKIFSLNGSSGGARPKINVVENNETWLVKFRTSNDPESIGKMEYDYFKCADNCGIKVADYKLFPSKKCDGYFGSKRFDNNKLVLTASAILESDYRAPALDYNSLIKLTNILTNGNKNEILNMFKLMCFNVFSHNRDDHGKNFSFIYQEDIDTWVMAPAYDLTYSNTYFGQHTTTVDGNGENPNKEDLLRVAKKNNINNIDNTIDEIAKIVETQLKQYL